MPKTLTKQRSASRKRTNNKIVAYWVDEPLTAADIREIEASERELRKGHYVTNEELRAYLGHHHA